MGSIASEAYRIGRAGRTRVPRFAEVAVERARLTVVPRGRASAARMPFFALVWMALAAGVVGLLLFNTTMQQASFDATALEARAARLTARSRCSTWSSTALRNPQRIGGEGAGGLRHGAGLHPGVPHARTTGEVTGQPCGRRPRRTVPDLGPGRAQEAGAVRSGAERRRGDRAGHFCPEVSGGATQPT